MGIYASVLPKGVACAYACSSNWYGLQLCLCRLLELQGRTGHRQDVHVPACWLVGTVPEQWGSTRGGGRAQLLGASLGRGAAQDVPWVLVNIWTSGQSKLGGRSLTRYPNWCGLCLCPCSLLGLWWRAGHGEDVQVCRAGQQSGTESSGWQGWEHSLEAGLSPACQLELQELFSTIKARDY